MLDCYYVNERIDRIYEIGTCKHCNKTDKMSSALKDGILIIANLTQLKEYYEKKFVDGKNPQE